MSDLVGNPEDRISRIVAHTSCDKIVCDEIGLQSTPKSSSPCSRFLPNHYQKLAHAIYSKFFSEAKIEIFIGKIFIFLIYLLKTLIVGIPLHTPLLLYKNGV